jgi:hypothetical protein
MASEAERNARLDALSTATTEWADSKIAAYDKQVALGKRILLGRTGSERLSNASVESVSGFTVDEINEFLTG